MNIRYIIPICFLVFIIACNNTSKEEHIDTPISKENHHPLLQELLDSALLEGSILVYDEEKDIYYSNNFERAHTGYLPASTFKIPNSIIALETGIVEDEHTIFKWNGEDRLMNIWEKDMDLEEAYQLSCVPCYQEIANKAGKNRMRKYLELLSFGKMQMDSSNLDVFWLQGESRISSFEQIDFLKRLNHSQLPISKNTENVMRTIMLLEENNHYQLRGKTGWSITDHKNLGWFVAILDSQGKTYYLATNIEPKDSFDMGQFPKARKLMSMKAFKILNLID